MIQRKGALYLVPNTLGKPETSDTIPRAVKEKVAGIRVFIVENVRNARRYLKQIDPSIRIDSLAFHQLNEHTSLDEIPGFLNETLHGSDTAILSEAGVPGVADPGSAVVRLAHEIGIQVIPLTGPSSILLSLMASGLNGQCFRFHGYLPKKRGERIRRIGELEQHAKRYGETQIFIETPYRNDGLLKDILEKCNRDTRVCIAADITLDSEYIATKTVLAWRKQIPVLHKRPVVFLIGM